MAFTSFYLAKDKKPMALKRIIIYKQQDNLTASLSSLITFYTQAQILTINSYLRHLKAFIIGTVIISVIFQPSIALQCRNIIYS